MREHKPLSVLFAIFEAEPFQKTGGLGDVGGALPPALKAIGCDIRVILPKFASIPEKYRQQMRKVAECTVPLAWRRQYCGIEMLEYKGTTYYFVDNEYYFRREKTYGYEDDVERTAFFSKAVLESLPYLPEFDCDIVHCNDWHTALIPVFLRAFYQKSPFHASLRTVFTIHNLAYQGISSWGLLTDVLGLDETSWEARQLEWDGAVNDMKGALLCSDLLTTVSPTYAEEILYPYFGEHMEPFFHQRKGRLFGVLNGIDRKDYDPAADACIAFPYDWQHLEKKAENKRALQQKLGLPPKARTPLFVMVSRLVEQKGLDLLLCILEEWLQGDIQVAILGNGEPRYEEALRALAERYPQKLRVCFVFDSILSRQFYAGADGLLMPSRFEPCGLSQLIAMRYGTLPIVRETGGLKDTVRPYNPANGSGWGFSFRNFNAHDFLYTLRQSEQVYREHPQVWQELVIQAMKADFGWERSAWKYKELYQKLLDEDF